MLNADSTASGEVRAENGPAEPPDDSLALAALGVGAYVLAATIHEAIGHGLTCLATGGHIRLLTSIFFRSEAGSEAGARLTDVAGPVANLLFGGGLYWLRRRVRARRAHLFLTLTMAFNLAWGSGYLLYSAALDTGDWVFAIRGWPAQPVWRAGFGVAGAFLYQLMLRATVARLRGTATRRQIRRRLLVPYLAAGVAAAAAAVCYAPNRAESVLEALQTSLLANAGLIWLALGWRPTPVFSAAPALAPQRLVLAATCVVWLAFAITLGRGLVFP